jgi:hypothetical protein
MVAVTLLQDERVREQLRKAPAAARTWAEQRREAASTAASTETSADPGPTAGERGGAGPTRRIGHRGIERRLAALRRNVGIAFGDPSTPEPVTILDAVDELERAATIAASLPLLERRRAQARVLAEIKRLEAALVDAVLPSSP